MRLYCNECYNEIKGGSVLVVQVLDITEGEIAILTPKAPLQKFCMGCAAKVFIELQKRFSGTVDEKLGELIRDFKKFLQDDDYHGIENVITYLRSGVNLYFGYDDNERNFFEGELVQCQLLTPQEAQELMEGPKGILENISNHVFITLNGTAFTVQDGNIFLKNQ